MTIKQLYDWAKKRNKENCELTYEGDLSLPMVVDYESTKDNIVGLLADTGLEQDYDGIIFNGKDDVYICGDERKIVKVQNLTKILNFGMISA